MILESDISFIPLSYQLKCDSFSLLIHVTHKFITNTHSRNKVLKWDVLTVGIIFPPCVSGPTSYLEAAVSGVEGLHVEELTEEQLAQRAKVWTFDNFIWTSDIFIENVPDHVLRGTGRIFNAHANTRYHNPILIDDICFQELCPFAANGECRYGDNCTYLHGDVCELCERAVLHPTEADEREKHIQVGLQKCCVTLNPPNSPEHDRWNFRPCIVGTEPWYV